MTDYITLYIIGALISMAVSMAIVYENRYEYLHKYTKTGIVLSVVYITLLSWLFVVIVLYKAVKRRAKKGL